MLHVITGGSGSGKSAFAETQVLNAGEGKRYYIATMIPYGEEGRQRVERHRTLRAKKEFETIECYKNLKAVNLPSDAIVLLECMSNLTANEIFEPDGAHEHTMDAITEGVRHLKDTVRHLFIVTNEVFSDGITYDPMTQDYLRVLGNVNQEICQMADHVTEVVYGIPLTVK